MKTPCMSGYNDIQQKIMLEFAKDDVREKLAELCRIWDLC